MIESIIVDPRIKVRNAKDLILLPKVVVVQSFDEAGAKAFRRDMSYAHRTGQTLIPIVIDSYGGEVYSLLSMVDIIRSSKLPVATIAHGKAMSCGSALFSCGTEGYRFIAPNATLMIHDTSHGFEGKNAEIQATARESARLNRKMYQVLDSNCKQKRGFFSRLVQTKSRADWYLSPKEALKLNLANHIGVPTFKTNVKVETVLEF